MGSLMAGWNSPVLGDTSKVRLMRNRSLTKEEVDAFWRQRRKPPSDDDGAAGDTSSPPLCSPRAAGVSAPASPLASSPGRVADHRGHEGLQLRRLERMRSLPSSAPLASSMWTDPRPSPSLHGGQSPSPCRSEPSSPATRVVGFADTTTSTCDWWTRSSWAFLNEPAAPELGEETSTAAVAVKSRTSYYASDQFYVARVVTGNA